MKKTFLKIGEWSLDVMGLLLSFVFFGLFFAGMQWLVETFLYHYGGWYTGIILTWTVGMLIYTFINWLRGKETRL